MERKVVDWKVKGMNRDLSVSAFNPEFSFENVNMRLSTNENNTLMSWVNEKGTERIVLQIGNNHVFSIEGTPIGTAVINSKLIVFTTKYYDGFNVNEDNPDYIYMFKWISKEKTEGVDTLLMSGKLLYNGNLNFRKEHPLETLVAWESNFIEKVYWTDGLNQPRIINVAIPDDEDTATGKWASDIYFPVDTYFDFVPGVHLNETMTVVQKTTGGGIFAPGVIQYCFTYVNKYAQQTNIIQVSPIYYLTKNNRGASPEEKVTCNFTITISDIDINFSYIRLYSIHRTSLDLDAQVKLLADIPINYDSTDTTVSYLDNGSTGSLIDPSELLYVGGREISASTFIDKDNTLFLGNIEEKNEIIDDIQEDISNKVKYGIIGIEFTNSNVNKIISNKNESIGNYYNYRSTLDNNNRVVTTFKGGDTYRFGFQLQKTTGEWSQPIFIMDQDNPLYPKTGLYDDLIYLVSAKATIPIGNIDTTIYKRIRPVVVYPNIEDRNVLCQGVLNPTVFNVEDRKDKYPYAQASWFFRPYTTVYDSDTISDAVDSLNISIIKGDEDSDKVPDAYFNNLCSTYYGIFAHVRKNHVSYVDYCISNNELVGIFDDYNGDSYTQHSAIISDMFGIVNLGKDLTGDTLFLILTNTNYFSEGRSSELVGIEGCYSVYGVGPISIYNNISKSVRNALYYVKADDSMPDAFVTKFMNGSIYYTIVFNSLSKGTNTSFTLVSGNSLPFTHYDSLITQDDYLIDLDDGDNIQETDDDYYRFYENTAKRVEIQGSIKRYNSPTDTANSVETNSQFFIDQSIVTLNSPDIDIDTQVQSYGTQGLKLRVIGAIPITANISSHKIINSSPMIEANHKVNEISGISADSSLKWGSGELPLNVGYPNISAKAGNRLIAEYLWNDTLINSVGVPDNGWSGVDTDDSLHDFMVYPWQRNGSLNNDQRANNDAASNLEKKKEANLLFSHNTEYLEGTVSYENISSQIVLTENAEIMNYKLPKQDQGDVSQNLKTSEINYYPNIDKLLYNTDGYRIIPLDAVLDSDTDDSIDNSEIDTVHKILKSNTTFSNAPVQMKYKSTSHAVIALNAYTGARGYFHSIPLLPYCTEERLIPVIEEGELPSLQKGPVNFGKYSQLDTSLYTFWEDIVKFEQNSIDVGGLFKDQTGEHISHNILWLGELYKEPVQRFGGTSKEALLANNWLPCGDAVDLIPKNIKDGAVELNWTEGDTYYQRYDCLKTYAFTPDDPNQIVEILSFMCETHVNLDGRYDSNRGQMENYDMDPSVFNLINPVYSQRNNFFTYRMMDTEDWNNGGLKYPNNFYWSKTKTMGERVDTWTNVTLASTMNLDGDKGEITSLQKFGNNIIAFQDTGIAQILYNENAQISPQIGVPIELANNGKVQGSRYISDTVGCSNKWSIANTPSGIYFMDSDGKNIYVFNGQLTNLSGGKGFNTWAKENIKSKEINWTPDGMENFTTFYDKLNHDVMFVNRDTALAFSDSFNEFTSFYSYNGAPFFCNLDDTGIWIAKSTLNSNDKYSLYKHHAGEYCTIFDSEVPYSMTFVGNPEPYLDKIFTNIEIRASVDNEGSTDSNGKYTPYIPFDSIETWNEYQRGTADLGYLFGKDYMRHFNGNTFPLNRKFRIWRCDIPRDNIRKMDRMRNPWIYLKLQKENDTSKRAEIHDVMMHYYI